MDAIFPQQPPAPRCPLFVFHLEKRPVPLVCVAQFFLERIGIVDHRPQLVSTELSPLLSHPQRGISNWPTGIQPNPKSRKRQDRRHKNKPAGGYNDIDAAFHGQPERWNRPPLEVDHRETTHLSYVRHPP